MTLNLKGVTYQIRTGQGGRNKLLKYWSEWTENSLIVNGNGLVNELDYL